MCRQRTFVGCVASVAVVLGLLLSACGSPEGEGAEAGLLRIDLDKSNPERLLRYYLGGYVAEGGGDPFAAGLLVNRDGRYFLRVDSLEARHPAMAAVLDPMKEDGRLNWDEFEAFVLDTYYEARRVPPTLTTFRRAVPYRRGDSSWFRVEMDAVMTEAQRHVYVAEAALRSALQTYHQHDEQLIYPVGTAIVGEHHLDGTHAETTVMRKRADGFWDYMTYGPDGTLTTRTQTPPRQLKSPTQCVGCHFGSKLFEPERSFPAEAPPGPHGPRAIYVGDTYRDREVVTFFDEHRKRSDEVLGLYNTLFVAKLRAERREGTLAAKDAQLLDTLGL